MLKQALISVFNKIGILNLARAFSAMQINILSTGGTAKLLIEHNIKVTEIADYTGFAEILNNRVKTLHPKIYGGILARRNFPEDIATLIKYTIPLIDIVVVNLYPFQETIARLECTVEDAVEQIDIGGATMLRSAAKNYKDVIVIYDPVDYQSIIEDLYKNHNIQYEKRFFLAKKTFTYIAQYDCAIANYFDKLTEKSNHIETYTKKKKYPSMLNLHFKKVQEIRYGENPHQSAAFYHDINNVNDALSNYIQIQGKELSFNNIVDADTASECIKTFNIDDNTTTEKNIACVIIKHATPCGVAIATNALDAYNKAFNTDPNSAFGSVIAFNTELHSTIAKIIIKQFVEVLIAPAFSAKAREILSFKKDIRLLKISFNFFNKDNIDCYDFKRINGGLLVQTLDTKNITPLEIKIVSKKQPTKIELQDLLFAWRVVKFIKSNAIVFCKNGTTLGIGAGQMSRVDSTRIALMKAHNAGLKLINSVVASDAFFPFRDGLDIVANAGANCVIHPGGSIRDQEIINAANEHNIALLITGTRHFRH